jgi:hypothetical protein
MFHVLPEHELKEAAALGLTRADLEAWAPCSALEVYWARKQGLPVEEARRWRGEGIPIRDAVRATALGLTPDQVREWTTEGFAPEDACEARESGVSLADAVAWRAVGFIAPDALQLIRHGWSLPEALRARYSEVDRYGVIGGPDSIDRKMGLYATPGRAYPAR